MKYHVYVYEEGGSPFGRLVFDGYTKSEANKAYDAAVNDSEALDYVRISMDEIQQVNVREWRRHY